MTVRQPLWLRKEDIPELPDGWQALTTVEATDQLKPGKLYDQKTSSPEGEVPVVNQSLDGFVGYHSNEPGVLASVSNPIVTFANHTCAIRLMKQPFSCIQNIFPKVGREGVCDTRYFYYATKGRVDLSDYKGHHPLFRQAYIPVPPLPTQQRIAAILSAYDNLIENNTRRIAILEEMARRLYEEWFVHFRFPGHEEVEFVGDGDDRRPAGWELGLLSDYIELKYGKALKASERVEGSFPVYGSSGIVGSHNLSLVNGPGIIVGRKGNVGSVFWSDEPFYPIDTVYFVQTSLPLQHVYFNLQMQNFLNNDAAVPGLNRQQAYSLPFVRPPNALLRRFVDVCQPTFAAHRMLRHKNANLRAQRDLLLPKLVSGEIDVSGAEAALEAAE